MRAILFALLLAAPVAAQQPDTTRYFPATPVRIVDGDTYEFAVALGFRVQMGVTVRLRGVDTPETFRPKTAEERSAGMRAKSVASGLIASRRCLLGRVTEDAVTFGRHVADVWCWDQRWISVGDSLVAGGLARRVK
jgi:endonuclease YncB( thermonuclease family)